MRTVRRISMACAALLTLSLTPAFASESSQWAIEVKLYRITPSETFKALDTLGSVILDETSNGFIQRSVVVREGFHRGITACLLIDSRLGSATEERDRIVSDIQNIDPGAGAITFTVNNPSSCM